MIAKKSRRVIFEGSDLAGIVTATDLVKGIYDSGEEFNIRSAITKKVTDYPETPVAIVIQDLNEKRIGSVMGVRDEMPYGIFTERDLIRRVLVPKRSLRTPVGDVVTTPLITAKADISGREAAKIMITNRIKRLPLFDKKAMVGIVTARDIVDAFARRST
jgi:CBS domain-containing protein